LFDPKLLSMASVKILLRKKINKDGQFPLCIQIIKNRKTSIIHLGQSINVQDWDETRQKVRKTHPNHNQLNNFLVKKLTEANSKFLELSTEKRLVSAKRISSELKSEKVSSFFAQANIYLDELKKSGKYNRYSADKPRINRFREFLKGEDVFFSEISISLINKFKAYLKGTREISDRTIINHLVVLRSIFSQAIKAELVDSKYYPFGKGKIQIKFPESSKISLNIDEVIKLENLVLDKYPNLDHARNLWLLSFYFAGMRISDLLRLRWSDFYNERLHYSMGKNAKVGSIKVPDKAKSILDKYKSVINSGESNYIFHHLNGLKKPNDKFELQQKIANAVKAIDESLQKLAYGMGIIKKLTMHVARHTFGNLSGDKIPIQMLQKLYRHSSITTTIGYQSNFINQDTDSALDSVLNF